MSKANQKFVQADEAVSPVIGVILMVAITVVLAAVVFVLVSNLSKTSNKAPDVSFSTDETNDRIVLIKSGTGLDWEDFKMKGNGIQVSYIRNSDAETVTSGTTSMATGYQAFSSAEFVAGDFIDFCRTDAANGGITIQILHTESNTVVYETNFNGVVAC